MLDSQLIYAVANDPTLRLRIEAIVRARLATKRVTATEATMLAEIPTAQLAWQVAGNPTIIGSVKTEIDAEAPQVATAVQAGISDSDLQFVIYSELTCLKD